MIRTPRRPRSRPTPPTPVVPSEPPPEPPSDSVKPNDEGWPLGRRLLAWGVHLYTGMGLVVAAIMAALLVRGGPDDIRWSFVLMVLATFIDATDGTLARRVKVKSVLPGFDGRRLDDIIDFLTYTCLPIMLVWRAGLMPPGQEAWLLVPLLASAYGFSQVDVKTDDGYFLGFPSLWNVVAFYVYVLPLPPAAVMAIMIVLGLMTFVPSRYLYPSQPGLLNMASSLLGAIWTLLLIALFAKWPTTDSLRPWTEGDATFRALVLASLFYPIFYIGVSWLITIRRWAADAAERSSPEPG